MSADIAKYKPGDMLRDKALQKDQYCLILSIFEDEERGTTFYSILDFETGNTMPYTTRYIDRLEWVELI